MLQNFPLAPDFAGLTHIDVLPVYFTNRATGERFVFPVYRYQEDQTNELILVTEDHFERILEKMIEIGAFGAKSGQP